MARNPSKRNDKPIDAARVAVGTGGEPDDTPGRSEGEPKSGAGNGSGNPDIIDPARIGSGNSGTGGEPAGGKRGPGRPRGSRSTARTSRTLDVKARGQLSTFLFQTHSLIASALTPYARLETGEAESLANAVCDVAELYDIPTVSQEAIAWGNLIQVLGFVYGTRVMAARTDAKRQQAERARPAGADDPRNKGSLTPSANAPRAEPIKPVTPSTMSMEFEGLGIIDVPTAP